MHLGLLQVASKRELDADDVLVTRQDLARRPELSEKNREDHVPVDPTGEGGSIRTDRALDARPERLGADAQMNRAAIDRAPWRESPSS